jgi:hypothetical protein
MWKRTLYERFILPEAINKIGYTQSSCLGVRKRKLYMALFYRQTIIV